MIASRSRSVAHKFLDGFYNGDSSVDSKSFDGLTKAIPAGQKRGGLNCASEEPRGRGTGLALRATEPWQNAWLT